MRPMPLILVLCLCTGIAASIVWWAGVGSADDVPPPAGVANATGVGGPGVGNAAEFDQILPVTNGTTPPDPAASEAGGDEARTEALPEPDTRLGPKVLVVRGQPPAPVADAVVYAVTEADAAERQRLKREHWSRYEWPEQFGQRLATDAQGLATLPATRRPWLVSAVSGDEFAFAVVPPGDRTVTMPLLLDEQVTVLATADDGTPGSALPVALLQHAKGKDEAEVLWDGTTDQAGRAICRHFQVARPELRGPAENERFAAMLVMSLPTPVVTLFPGRPTTSEPVRLQVPPHTRVEVLLTDHRGTPLLSPATVALWIERPRDFVLPFPVPSGLDRPRLDKPVGPDPVTFPRVATNSPIRTGARVANERRGAMSGPLWTPADPKEPLRTELPLAPELALLAGRVVLASGAPFGPREITGWLWRADRPVGQVTVFTAADGRFDLVQRPISDAAELWLELRATEPGDFPVEVAAGQVLAAVPHEVGVRVRFQPLQAGERRELGTLVLGELPPICSGIVVDDLGAPVANAEVKLQRNEPEPPGPAGQPPGRTKGEPRDPWRDMPLLATRSDPDGRFVLRGEMPRGELRVRADTDQHFADSQALRSLGQELRITIQRNGVLRGRVLLPDWIADGSVTLTLRPVDETVRARDTRTLGLSRRGGGRFTMEPLRPGRYDAVVAVRNLPEPLCVLGDLFVTPGEIRDARLRPLDLRQSLFRYRLRAVDPSGQTMPLDGPIIARLKQPDGSVTQAGFRWQKGRAEMITGSTLADLVAFGKGCEPTAVTLGPGDHDVYLRQVQPAQVYLPGARALCGPLRKVRISVVLTEDTGFPQWLQGVDQRTGEGFSFPRWELGKSNGAWLGQSDNVEIPLARSGKYEVFLRPHATESERSPQASVLLGVYELRVDSASMVPVTIPLDAAKVEAALASLQQQLQQQRDAQQRQNEGRGDRRQRNPNGGR